MATIYEHIPDVDIDVANRDKVLEAFPNAISASVVSAKNDLVAHNTGVYFQNIPVDTETGIAAFPYKEAEALGYYKLDFINYNVYKDVVSEEELSEMVAFAESPDFPWECMLDEDFYNNEDPSLRLTHLADHYETVKRYPPKSVLDVAALIALIRPRKKYLIGQPWSVIQSKIWIDCPEENQNDSKGAYFFKKSHAVAFALVVLVHLQILSIKLGS